MMFLWKTINIAYNERGFLYRQNRLLRVLEPGCHRVQTLTGSVQVEIFDISSVFFRHPKAKFLLKMNAELLGEYIDCHEMADDQIGLVYLDSHLADILEPGAYRAFWKDIEKVSIEIVDLANDYRVDKKLIGLLSNDMNEANHSISYAVNYVEVPDEFVGLLSVNGKFEEILKAGAHAFWEFNRTVDVRLLDLRLHSIDVSGQEILTKDRVSLRLNMVGTYQIKDPKLVATGLVDLTDFVYRECQLSLRESVGCRDLDALLNEKDALNEVILSQVKSRCLAYGVEIKSIGVKDIILPGEMKLILNQVVQAQKESEANLIRRREETQAMRSLHNTAKLMENNATLLRLKELEMLEKVTSSIDSISVYGGLDSVLNDLVKLKPASNS